MKTILMQGPRKSKVVQTDIPKIGENQLLVKLTYTGVCSSEMPPWTQAVPGMRFGHEPVGVVVDVGDDVTGFKIGDRVSGLGGGYSEYIAMDSRHTVHIPDNLPDEDAVAEALSCQLSAVSRLPVAIAGDTAVVVGAGYMGLGTVALYKMLGAGRIIAIDEREEALENAKRFGVDEVYTPGSLPKDCRLDWSNWGKDDLTRAEKVTDIFNTGFKSVMEFTGTESGLRLAGDLISAHGTLGIGGYHNEGDGRNVDFKLWNVKAITAINCHERRVGYQTELCARSLELLDCGLWKFKGAATHIYGMDEFDKANEDLIGKPKGFIKALIKCGE